MGGTDCSFTYYLLMKQSKLLDTLFSEISNTILTTHTVGGTSSHVGVAGVTLHGGYGFLTGEYG